MPVRKRVRSKRWLSPSLQRLKAMEAKRRDVGIRSADWVKAVAADLEANRGQCVIVPGDYQPPAVHALAHALNSRLGNVGKTVVFTNPIMGDVREPLGYLCDDMDRGQVEVLLILGGNPVFDAPADLDFKARMEQVPLRVHLGLFENETSRYCQWHIPEAHYLETWSDAHTFDGNAARSCSR